MDIFEKYRQDNNKKAYDKLFYKLGSGIFPAVLIGGEDSGVDFWLVMTNGTGRSSDDKQLIKKSLPYTEVLI